VEELLFDEGEELRVENGKLKTGFHLAWDFFCNSIFIIDFLNVQYSMLNIPPTPKGE